MNEVFREVETWFKANNISFNISKTKYSLFNSARKTNNIPNILPPLLIDNVEIKRKFPTTFLGV